MFVSRIFKLLLWLQFLRRGMLSSFWRYYGALWIVVGLVLTGSLALMAYSPKYPAVGATSSTTLLVTCLSAIVVGYCAARILGPAPLIAVCIFVPAIYIITPQSAGSPEDAIVNRTDDGPGSGGPDLILGTGDLRLFVKGSVVASCLLAFSYVAFRVLQIPWPFVNLGRWSLRWATVLAVAIVGIASLELLRNLTDVFPTIRVPGRTLILTVLREPGWPRAICFWLWADMALLMALYDDELIPYLLHRTGHQWAPRRLTLQDAFMVDSLLEALAELRKKGRDSSRSPARPLRSRRD